MQALLEIVSGWGSQTSQGRDANSPGGSGAVRETKGGYVAALLEKFWDSTIDGNVLIHIMVYRVIIHNHMIW